MKSLAVFLPEIGTGGAERAHINMAPAFIAAGYDVTFIVQHADGERMADIPAGVKTLSLNRKRTLGCLFPLMRYLIKQKPDILLSNLGHNNIVAIWAAVLARSKTRIAVTQHNILSQECRFKRNWQYKILPLLSRMFLGKADAIIAVSEGAARDLAEVCRLPAERISFIPNPIVTDDFDALVSEPTTHPWFSEDTPIILGVGRLVEEKDFRTLVSAFALAAQQRDLRLVILGYGPLRGALWTQAAKLGVADRIALSGFIANPLPYMKRAKMLAVSSLYEGFGNVVAEALACGTNVVSTDCPYGPREILDGGRFGRLVPVGDAAAMAEALLDATDKPDDGDKLQARGQSYGVLRAAESYVRLFSALER